MGGLNITIAATGCSVLFKKGGLDGIKEARIIGSFKDLDPIKTGLLYGNRIKLFCPLMLSLSGSNEQKTIKVVGMEKALDTMLVLGVEKMRKSLKVIDWEK